MTNSLDSREGDQSSLKEQLHRLIIENESEDGSIPYADQSAMANEIMQLFAQHTQQAAEKARVSELQKLVRFLRLAHLYDQDSAMKLRYHIDNRLAELASTQPEKGSDKE